MLYLDFAASAPIRMAALKVLEESSRSDFANPSAGHKFGRFVFNKVEKSREFFLENIGGINSYQLIFTSSATESNNMLIKGLPLNAGDKIYLCKGDHPSIVTPSMNLSKKEITTLSIPLNTNSTIDEERFLSLLDGSVKLILLTHVNSQSGVVNNCFNLAKKIKKIFKNIHIHVDAVQSFSKFEINLRDQSVDSLSISSHKIGGPKGIAGLYLKKGVNLFPLLEGGGQEFSLRSSTVPAPLIESFKEALSECLQNQEEKLELGKKNFLFLKEELKKEIPDIIFPFGDCFNTGPYLLVFAVPKISSDIILRHLESRDIMVSSTSACSSKIKGDNPTFEALGLPKKFHKNVLRVSFDERIGKKELLNFSHEMGEIYRDLIHLI